MSSIRNSNTESSNIVCNADMSIGEVRQFCALQPEGVALSHVEVSKPEAGGDIVLCMSQLNLSARACNRILKLSCTIADLAGSEETQSPHLAETLQYRPKMMM